MRTDETCRKIYKKRIKSILIRKNLVLKKEEINFFKAETKSKIRCLLDR